MRMPALKEFKSVACKRFSKPKLTNKGDHSIEWWDKINHNGEGTLTGNGATAHGVVVVVARVARSGGT